MKDILEIRNYIEHAPVDEKLVLCTLVGKTGSSYRSVGAKKLISLSGASCGLLSGGCLEGSIEKTARERYQEMPFTESFSTLSDEDRLMGYQTGCQGVIEVLFEQISASADLNKILPYEAVKLYIVGCGADAPAYQNFAHNLGWKLTYIDYRRDLAQAKNFPLAEVYCMPSDQIARHIPQGPLTAVVLMTHNYEADLEILRGLRNHSIGYLGCLGPLARYERLKTDLFCFHNEFVSPQLEQVVSAPAGLYTHSHSPQEIALSVIAQIQGRVIEPQKSNVWTLILAAGASRRFGTAKALAPWNEHTLLAESLKTAKTLHPSRHVVVTGGYAPEIQKHLQEDLKCTSFIFNSEWQNGMGSSISYGIASLLKKDPHAEMIVIMPVDQPWIRASHLQKLIQQSALTHRCALTEGDGFFGPPAVIPRAYFAAAQKLQGDEGLKKFLRYSDMVFVSAPKDAQDIDRPEDLRDLQVERGV